jgi:transcriptional regulator with XRE-family HTH domain
MQDPAFAARFKQAGEAWDVALQIAALREQAGLSQTELARKLKTSQQQISRLESPGYEGHSLSMLRRVAKVLHARVCVVIQAETRGNADALAEDPPLIARNAPAPSPWPSDRGWGRGPAADGGQGAV